MKLTRTTRFAHTPFFLVPVVDLVFLLLLFFVLNTTVITQSGVHVELSTSRYTLGLQPDALIISVTAPPNQRIYFKDRLLSIPDLRAVLEEQPNKDRTVIIKPDRRVDQSSLLEVATVALDAGFNVGWATMPPATQAPWTASPSPAASPAPDAAGDEQPAPGTKASGEPANTPRD